MINKAKVVNNHFNLGDSFYHIATPAKFPRHILRFRNDRAAKLLDLDHLSNDQWVRFFGQGVGVGDVGRGRNVLKGEGTIGDEFE